MPEAVFKFHFTIQTPILEYLIPDVGRMLTSPDCILQLPLN